MDSKQTDFWITTGLLLVGAVVWHWFYLPPVLGGAVYILPASAYLFFRTQGKNLKRLLSSVLIFGFIFGFGFDFFENVNKAWEVHRLIFPSLLRIQPIDNILGYGMMTLLMVLFYQRFFEKDSTDRLSSRVFPILILSLIVCVGLVTAYVLTPYVLSIPYAYAMGGLLPVIAVLFYGTRHLETVGEMSLVSSYFFFVWLVAEYVSVSTGGWVYPGQYVGSLTLLGISFPLEELMFWMVWYGATTVVFYKAFIDHE